MKKHYFTFLVLGVFCFSSLPVQAIIWGSHFVNFCVPDLFEGKKQPPTLLEELNDPELIIQSTISPHRFGAYIGSHPIPHIIREWVHQPAERQVKYSFAYIPPRKRRKETGHIALSFKLSLAPDQGYQHWIFWPSNAENAHLDESTAKALFNKVYEGVYGKDLDWMVENHVIPKTIFSLAKQDGFHGVAAASYVDQFKLHEVFQFDSLLFKGSEGELKLLVAEVIQNPDQSQASSPGITASSYVDQSLDQSQTGSAKAIPSRMHPEMESAIQEITMKEATGQIMSLAEVRGRIKLDIDSLYPEDVVKLLTENEDGRARDRREALTPEQVRQIDVSVPDIQYVFAPTFKHFRHVFRNREVLNIDTLSDEQIMSFDRDTFLRDVFLAGELYVQGPMMRDWDVTQFMITMQSRAKEKGRDVVMGESLPKEVHDFILSELGFEADFEDMTPAERRKVFKAEIKMMTDFKQQMKIIEELVGVIMVRQIFTEEQQNKP